MSTRLWLYALLLLATPAIQAAPAVYEDRVEDYVVVAGDTISGITRRFLGEETFWEDNWKLNPQVRDPDLLRIGQRLRIIVQRKVIAESAQVVEAINRTEKMRVRPTWEPASSGDRLSAGQGLRTREKSAAELRFNAESSLRLGEFSQVFLAAKETSLRGVDRGSIKVEQGNVDLRFAPLQRPRTQIELITGPSTTAPQTQPGQPTEIRTGATDDGGARVMVFAGRSQVSAGGGQVDVAAGMGTRVADSGPPTPPEKLLPAPQPESAALNWPYANGLLRWQPVAEAAGYLVEVCADPACARLHQREALPAGTTRLQVTPLPLGTHHWRVHAVSTSGLDGYASAAATIEVTDSRVDHLPPLLALRPLSGFVLDPQGAVRLGPAATFELLAHDELAGVARIEISRDGGDWQAWTPTPITLAELRDGRTRFRAVDRLEQVSPALRLDISAIR